MSLNFEKVREIVANPEEIFENAFNEWYFGKYLFGSSKEHSHEFEVEENEAAFCIVADPDKGRAALYKVCELSSTATPPFKTSVNSRVDLEYCKGINNSRIIFHQSSDLREDMKAGGREFAEIANGAFLDVLRASVKDENIVQVNDSQLGNFLSQLYSEFGRKNYRLNTILFSEHLRQLLVVNDIVISDVDIHNECYIGKTKGGSNAFCTEDLPPNTAIAFDKKIGFVLTGREEFGMRSRSFPNIAEVCGYLPLNPIVKDRRGVVLIEGIEEGLSGGVYAKPELAQRGNKGVFVNLKRIEDLRAVSSPDFDLRRLIKLCEELNTCWENECYLATAALTRTIMNHVPPIFSASNFEGVANNYPFSRSVKKQMLGLLDFNKHVADDYLHDQIKKNVMLPNDTQVDCRQAMDTLLGQVILRLNQTNS